MTIITNPDPTSSSFVNGDALVRTFFNDILLIDLTGKSLKLAFDELGRINEIDLDSTVSLSAGEITQVQNEFYGMSVDTIINSLGVSDPPLATVFLTDQGAMSPAIIPITTQSELTDLTVVSGWNIGADSNLFTLVDADTGELRFDGLTSKIVTIHYAATIGVTNQFDHVFLSIMRTPDGGSKAEIPESRMYLETINTSDGMPISNTITFKLDPLDKIKINGANDDGTINLQISIATMAVK